MMGTSEMSEGPGRRDRGLVLGVVGCRSQLMRESEGVSNILREREGGREEGGRETR